MPIPRDRAQCQGLAVVTGASSGIGRELARLLAADGHTVLLAADDPEVHDVAAELVDLSGAPGRAVAIPVDLASEAGVEELHRCITEHPEPLRVLALNAGIGVAGATVEVAVHDQLRVVDLDVRSTVHLGALLLPEMVRQRRGRVLVTSSIASAAPGPWMATYSASKAFVHSWAEALRHELRGTGVSVTSMRPGPVATAFFARNEMTDTRIAQLRVGKDSAARVARDGYDAMLAGRSQVVPGAPLHRLAYRAALAGAGVLPDRLTALAGAVMMRPGTDGSAAPEG